MIGVAVMSLPVKADYSSEVQGDGPVAYYQFEDASSADGAACADTMGNHAAYYIADTNTGQTVTLGAGLFGNAATFYGSGPVAGKGTAVHISGGNASGLELQTMTVEFLINAPFAVDTYQAMYSHKDGYQAEPRAYISGDYGSAAQLGVQGPNEFWYTNYAPGDVFDSDWHHVAVSYEYNSGTDHTTMSWYYEGALVGTLVDEGPLDYSGLAEWSDPMIGANGNAGYVYNCFIGTLDDVAIYDYALSEEQILAHYNAIPEPMTIALLGLGGLLLRRRKR
jgi:hypothetical protein